ncbi:protein kinase C delta type-like [Rhinoderma darwinii]|uniref:protein kinase C delta type-like n=1 Tax=Rhinoderma darwinii TaxID=43563 RepID=UPI003F66A9F2
MGGRRRGKKKKDSTPNKIKGDWSPRGKQTTFDEGETANKKKELSPKVGKMDSKKCGEQAGQANLAKNKVTENSPLLHAVQKKWGKIKQYIKNHSDNIQKKMHIRERQRDTVGQSWINTVKGSANVEKEGETGKKRKQQEDPGPFKDDISDEGCGPSIKHRRITFRLTLDKFILHSILGEGSYGKVILATDSIRKESVALKIVKKRGLIAFKQCFVEHRVLRYAHRSNFLIRGYAAFHTQNYAYYVTELARGGNLHEYINENLLPMDVIRFISAEIICGLKFMHTNGFIHRDIKSDNILLTGDGHIKITDFGLALYDVYGRVNARDYSGTPGYGAPEMIMGQSYNAGVDWFALGVLLYYMIFRSKPFQGNSIAEIKKNVIDQEPSYGKVTDHAAVDFMSRLLCKDQSVRLGVNGKIKNHCFFSTLNWAAVETGKMPSPVSVKKDIDVCMSEEVPAPNSEDLKEPISAEGQALFNSFPFVCRAWRNNYRNAPPVQQCTSHHNNESI